MNGRGSAAPPPRSAQYQHAEHDQDDPGDAGRTGPLTEQGDPRQRGQQRTAAPAQRVDQGQIAEPVPGLQKQEVADLEQPGPES